MTETDPEFAEEGEGGPRKSFWGHLQDLRTALVRSAIAVVIALSVCLLFDVRLVSLLEYPLRRMEAYERAFGNPSPTVTLELGGAQLGPYAVTRKDFPALPEGRSPQAVYKVTTVVIGGQQVLALKPDPHPPSPALSVRLHNLSPAEAFFVAFHVAIYAALAVSSPFWIYFLGGFILPAFNLRERRLVLGWLGWSVALFLAGVLSTYYVLLPVALRASMKYSELMGFSAADWRADEYITFVSKFLLGMGVGFQFPLVVLFLVKLGILSYRQLAKFRRYVIVLSLILGAVLTTPEPITQIAMAVPLYLLYESCILIAWYWEWRKRKRGEYLPEA